MNKPTVHYDFQSDVLYLWCGMERKLAVTQRPMYAEIITMEHN